MPSVNARLQDEAIDHAVDERRYSNWVVQRMIAVLNRSDARLMAQLSEALLQLEADSFTVERLEVLLTSLRAVNAQAYAQVYDALQEPLQGMATAEAQWQASSLRAALPAPVLPRQVGVRSPLHLRAGDVQRDDGQALHQRAGLLDVGMALRRHVARQARHVVHQQRPPGLAEQAVENVRQHLVGAVARKNLRGIDAMQGRDSLAQRHAVVIGIQAQAVAGGRAYGLERARRGGIRMLVGIELEQAVHARLFAGSVRSEIGDVIAPVIALAGQLRPLYVWIVRRLEFDAQGRAGEIEGLAKARL